MNRRTPTRSERADRTARGVRGSEDRARRAAYESVATVHRDDAYANLTVPAVLSDAGLTGRDAAFATELAYGTLRRRGTLDAVLEVAARRPVTRIDPPARDALRIGAYQHMFTRVPPHAAVSSTVALVKQVAPGATGFANAVMRRISDEDPSQWWRQVLPAAEDDPVEHLAVRHSHPAWIVRAFAELLDAGPPAPDGQGGPAGTWGPLAETARALAADNEPPSVHLCARPGRITRDELAAQVGGGPGAHSPYAVVLDGGAPGSVAAVGAGRAHVQDEGSQLVTSALVDVPVSEGPAQQWLDLCAGPGGKAALLGALAAGHGARVTAVEVAAHRATLVEQAVRGFPVTVVETDGREVGDARIPAGGFDRVLVDAPCTGLGALRRRPELRWRRRPADLPALTRLQRELLVAAIAAARPGGVVAYATCSPHRAETEVTVAEARRRSPHRTDLLDARRYLPRSLGWLGDGPTVQLWPHRHGTDAMFLALLRRTA